MTKRMSLDDWEARKKAPAEPQTWFTPKQAAVYLSLGLSTLAKMRLAGTGPDFVRPCSNSVRYHREALNKWMASTLAVPQAAE
jgi:excisionase family DNA binding protein